MLQRVKPDPYQYPALKKCGSGYKKTVKTPDSDPTKIPGYYLIRNTALQSLIHESNKNTFSTSYIFYQI